ncbi:phage tail tape measure protein [Cronobacter sakazakii]|uniref:phage tail tape measure protein n=1 Tax=Cronobacter sakazakii TaxID=28141 RepID=UPI000949119C|nr:phage tail tape measure protein [Cronobacter sakazakii]PUX30553.1 phage tail tape measure protein [Cronobacter sakazakii]PUX49647.1 phage tail tape measure protein [Cronobacter sakazakii]PUX56663.1 phage tail tape measure protein [Cronobacter sakazakii]PUX59489.1 phage tail tape measure protein [Cronobacter sakazakii]
MARNLQLALQLLARDTGSKVLKQALQGISRDTKAAQKTDDELAKSRQQNSATAIRASRSLIEEYRRASSARSTLGIRSEREIQREIQQTMAAYNRLTRTGMLSANEQNRAFKAMTDRVKTLRTELGGVNDSMTRMQRFRAAGSTVAAVAGGLTAAGMIIKDPVQRQMAFERRNAEIANTAYNELSGPERIKKIPVINNAIRDAVRYGGGTPEAAQDTLNALFAGSLDEKTAMKILPDITRYASASGANPQDLAKIGISAIKNFDIDPKDLPTVYDKSIRSGENGKYELADMASSLSLTLTKAKSIGMSGLGDFDKILALLQANAETAGDNSAASTNVNNLLDKITSADIQNTLKNYKFRGKGGKALGYIDYLAEQKTNGLSTPDIVMNAVSGIVSADKRVQKLRSEAKKYKGTDKESDILAALDIVVSSITSKIIADQQASTALKTNIMKREFIKDQIKGTENSSGAGAASFEVMSSTNDFKSQQFESEKMFSEQDAMKPLADLYGDLTSKLTDYAKEYPELTTAISGATTGIKAMTAAAVAFAGLNFLTGGGIKMPGSSGGGVPPAGGSALGRTWSAIRGAAGKVLAPLALYQGMQDAPLVHIERGDADARERLKVDNYSSESARMLDAVKARPGLLDAVDEIKSWWNSPATMGQNTPATTGVPSYLLPQQQQKSQPINFTTKLILDGREIASAVNEYNGDQSVRGSTGGPQ